MATSQDNSLTHTWDSSISVHCQCTYMEITPPPDNTQSSHVSRDAKADAPPNNCSGTRGAETHTNTGACRRIYGRLSFKSQWCGKKTSGREGVDQKRQQKMEPQFINYAPWYWIFLIKLHQRLSYLTEVLQWCCGRHWTLSFLTGSLLIACPSHRVMISCSTTAAKRGRNSGQMEPGLKAGTWGGGLIQDVQSISCRISAISKLSSSNSDF